MNKHRQTILLVFIGLIFSVVYLQSVFRWWFEDDPLQLYYVAQIKNPIHIFIDPKVLAGFGVGKAIVPMQILSYWIDVSLFGYNPAAIYIHSFISLLLTLAVMHIALRHWTQNKIAAFGGALLWLLLPTTIATHHFISTRHYIEGLFFGLLMCCLVQKFNENKERNLSLLILIAFSGIVAMLFKEIYATLVVTFLMLAGIHRRSYSLITLSALLTIFYAIYRLLMVGSDVSYTMPFLGFREYLNYLAILPYTFSANSGGYLIYAGVALLTAILIKRYKTGESLFFFLLLSAALAAVYPVAFAVLTTYETPGTWYRAPFIINTLFAMWLAYLLSRTLPKKLVIAGLIAILIVLPGTHRTRQYWEGRLTRAEAEGKFYLENPDKLIYSEEDADWFILGVHVMYQVSQEHYVNKQSVPSEKARLMVGKYPTIWRYQNGHYAPDDALYNKIQDETEAK